MIKDEQLAAYKEMAKNASENSMEAQIEANLRATCDKFAGHEDRLEDCMEYLTECAREILNGKNGEVDDDTCYRICLDYFNDEIWAKEDEAKAAKEAKRKAAKERAEAERIELEKRRKKANKEFVKIASKFASALISKNGLKVFVPKNISSVIEQAKKLHQCLITADYTGKMARKKCLLVFITTKNGKPVATAEIRKDGQIVQFYGDESRPRDKMKPSENAVSIMDAWLSKYSGKVKKILKEAA